MSDKHDDTTNSAGILLFVAIYYRINNNSRKNIKRTGTILGISLRECPEVEYTSSSLRTVCTLL